MSRKKGDANTTPRIPVVERLFLKKDELSARRKRKIDEFICRVGIITKDNRGTSKLRFDSFVFSFFIFCRVVTIIDKNVDLLTQPLQRFNRIAIQHFAKGAVRCASK